MAEEQAAAKAQRVVMVQGSSSVSNAGLIIVTVFEAIGMGVAVFLFGLPLLFPVLMALTVGALMLRGFATTTVVLASHVVLGFAFAVILLMDYLYFVLQILGAVDVWFIVNHFATPRQAPVTAEGT